MLVRFGGRLSFVVAGVAAILLGIVWIATMSDRAAATRATQRPQWALLLNNAFGCAAIADVVFWAAVINIAGA